MPMRKLLFVLLACLAGAGCAAGPGMEKSAAVTRIAFGSCADQKLPQPIWKAVLLSDPDAFLFLGDNVYGDVSSTELTNLKGAYDRFAQSPALARLQAETRVLATWDDHDYGRNDGGAGFQWREESEALFLDFWKVPAGDPRRSRDGVYFAETFGEPGRRVQVIMLDTRYFRSPLKESGVKDPKYDSDIDPGKTMLGLDQWRWLESELKKPADVRLLVSSIQVAAEDHGWERWGNLPLQRRKLYNLIAGTGAKGVVLLSGDRHFGGLYVERNGTPYPLYEATSSSLNRPWREAQEKDSKQIGDIYAAENFGTVDIDWAAGEITLALRGMDGQAARSQAIRIDELSP